MSSTTETPQKTHGRLPGMPRRMLLTELERNARHSRFGGLTLGLSPQQISGATGLDLKLVRVTLNNMQGAGKIANIGTHNKPRWCLSTCVEGVDRSRRAGGTGFYDGAELRRNVGIPPDRFRAFELPSRMGNWLHWPDGRITAVDAR